MSTGAACEVCVDSVASAMAAEEGGAARVELCSALFEGGLTPSLGLLRHQKPSPLTLPLPRAVKKAVKLDVFVMVRPRGGDFCYTDAELDVMKDDIDIFKAEGVAGVVFGILKPDGSVDVERTGELVRLARPLQVTFHRAFDMAKDHMQAMEDIISLGVERILTSGGDSTCLEGLDVLASLVQKAGNRVTIVPGGGITERNIQRILGGCQAKEFHVSGRTTQDSQMVYRNGSCFMGGVLRPPEFAVSVVNPDRVRSFLDRAS